MADEDDKKVAGPPPAQTPPAAGTGEAPPPPPPGQAPPGPPPFPPPPHRTHAVRRWDGRGAVPLLVAGLVGAIIGGGLVGLADLLDDRGEERYVRVVDVDGDRPWRRWDDDGWRERVPPEWRVPRRFQTPEVPPTDVPSPAPTG
ncbi:hypothetical protein [Thermomonospora amylolytica]|uniref:hypothetical protein n=1 Tax=Thermomonospora amylolytica TaxID=1411117 RepID=UPI000E6BDD22|nr:hypothetical protein [Thermomonospora amylolytica]